MPAMSAVEREEFTLNRARAIITTRMKRREQLRNVSMAKFMFQLSLHREERECFEVLYLDSQRGMLAHERLFQGNATGAEVHPGVVARSALQHGAVGVIVAHNHPGGSTVPSRADHNITARLRDALALVDVQLIDHILVAGAEALSFAEEGWL